ncbi:MAG: ferredoxin [Planctomycetes bacterium]|nr:ferredoxin [Planctomycetota bacterium]
MSTVIPVPARTVPVSRPRLPQAGTPLAPEVLRHLRRAHLGVGPGTPLPAGSLPALLAPFRDPERVRHEFPHFLSEAGEAVSCQPLGDVLAEVLARVVPDDRVLHDNVVRLECCARTLLAQGGDTAAAALVQRAGVQMLQQLEIPTAPAASAQEALAKACAALPEGELLSLAPGTPLRLLQAAARERARRARPALKKRVQHAAEDLRGLLRLEESKDTEAREGGALQRSLGSAAERFLDAGALAKAVGPHRGTQPADPGRRGRLADALAALDEHLRREAAPELVVVHEAGASVVPGLETSESAEPCAAAAERFDREAGRLVALARALRVADLEVRGAFEPARHEPLVAALDLFDCTREELHTLPVIAAVVHAATLARDGLRALTRLLHSGRAVHVLVLESPARDPGTGEREVLGAPRLELAYLGIAHREVYVQQSSAARPRHLLAGFQRALHGARPALHVVHSGLDADGQVPALGAFLHAGAAIEGRALPLCHYDPEAGETWARRFDLANNPAPADEWPVAELQCLGADGNAAKLTLPFTFVDFAVLEPRFAPLFTLVPDGATADELVAVDEYLRLDAEHAVRRLPYVWVADAEQVLHRAVPARALVEACRDRLRFWRTLQELAGVRNEHVREAVQRAHEEAAAQARQEREALLAEHAKELERARAETTGVAMQRLARMLLQIEPVALAPDAPPPAAQGALAAPAVAAAPAAAPAPAPAPAAAAAPEIEEPWIDTARCSSCNDCVNLNPLLFVYNANKQARIGDPRAGTFRQLVQAAEKCPSRCIHPGKPLNPAEPGLAELVRRAEPFNR